MQTQVICTTDGDAKTNGVVTFWRLSGAIDVTRLVEAWDDRGWDPDLLPSTPSETVALRRAVMDLYQGKGTLVRPVVGEHATAVLDLAVAPVEGSKSRPGYITRFVVWIDEDGVPHSDPPLELGEKQKLFSQFAAVAQRIEEELSGWFARIVFALGGVALRDSGGVYFVPTSSQAMTWEAFAELVEEISACRVYQIPAMDTESATRAILDSLNDEVVKAQSQITEALDEKTFGKRALKSRVERVQDLMNKVSRYEDMFNARLSDLRTGLDGLQARIVESILVAEEDV